MHLAKSLCPFLMLAACHQEPTATAGHRWSGRYSGVGTYPAGQLWAHLKLPGPKEADAATIADDEHVIVTVDGETGEVRECGDLSGACLAINPWRRRSPGDAQSARLVIHAAELAAQQADENKHAR